MANIIKFNRPIREPVSIDGETMNMVLNRIFLAPINIFASVDDDGEVVGYAAAFIPENIKDENARPFFEEWAALYQPEKEEWRLFEDTGSLITTLLDCLVGYYEHLASLDKVPEKP